MPGPPAAQLAVIAVPGKCDIFADEEKAAKQGVLWPLIKQDGFGDAWASAMLIDEGNTQR